ncbi:hypothetical protein [Thermococcus peptonophilus]|uniref:hypothetical protein n=1 Tax=Thermococcus peptonophilus TaxID=53952 RepID=UPI0006D02159
MKLAEAVTNVKEVEKKAEKEYKALLKTLKSPEYADLRVLLLRMTVDTILHRRLAEALEKAYKEAIELIEEFGYVDVPETPETAPPRNQVSSGLVLIPGIPAVHVAPPTGSLEAESRLRMPSKSCSRTFRITWPSHPRSSRK